MTEVMLQQRGRFDINAEETPIQELCKFKDIYMNCLDQINAIINQTGE